jgi:hypothetical protein
MQNLEKFNQKLQRDYPRYRVRWSDFSGNFKIEVKMGTGYWDVNPELFKDNPDLYIQVKDGYIEWAEITTGDRARCAHCTNTVEVPVREFREVKCNWCDMAQPARAYFELNDDLLYHLNKLNRQRTSPRLHRSNNENLFDKGMDEAFDKAYYSAKWESWRVNNGVRVSVPQNFRKVV